MEVVAGLLVLGGLVLFVLALVALVRPMPKLRMGTRRAAAVGMALSVGSCVVGTMMASPEGAQAPQGEAAEQTAAKSETPEQDEVLHAQIREVWKEFMAAARPCDLAGERVATMSERLQTGQASIYETYGFVVRARDACRESSVAALRLDAPAAARGATKKAFDDALSTCTLSFAGKQRAYDKMAKVLDGDSRPSAVSAMEETMSGAVAEQIRCVAQFMGAASEAGVPLEDLGS